MVKKSTGLLLLSVLFLSSCVKPEGTSASLSTKEDASSSSVDAGSSTTTSSSSSSALQDWTEEEKALVKEKFGEGVIEAIPYYAPASYAFVYDTEYSCFSYVSASITEASAVTDYQALLDKKGYATSVDSEGDLTAFAYYNEAGDGLHFDAYLLEEAAGFEIDIYQHTYVAPTNPRNAWNSTESALFDKYFYSGASKVIPCSAWGEMALTDGMKSTSNLYLYDVHGGSKEVSAYIASLTGASYVHNEEKDAYELAIKGQGTISVEAFIDSFGDLYFTYSFQKEITGDVTWTSTSIAGITYDSTSGTFEGIAVTIEGICVGSKGGATIQMRGSGKGGSSIENVNAVPPLQSIALDQYTEGKGYDGTLTISAGTSKDALQEITPTNNVYALSGATYFKIENKSDYACYVKSFLFSLVK
jgi:hypothetical protein